MQRGFMKNPVKLEYTPWQKVAFVLAAIVYLVAGVYSSSMLTLALLVVALLLVLASMYPEKILYVFLFLYALTPSFLGIDLGANLPLITVSRGIFFLYVALELVLNRRIFINNLYRLKHNSLNFVVVLFVLVHVLVLVQYLNAEAIKKFVSLLVENLLLMYIMYLRIRNKAELKKCIDILLISAVVVCLFGSLEFVTGENLFIRLGGARDGYESMISAGEVLIRSGFNRIYGPFIHPLAMACYLVIMLPLAIEGFISETAPARKVLYGIAACLIGGNLLFTMSRAPLIFMAVGFVAYFFFLERKIKVAMLKIIGPGLLVLVILGLYGLAPSFITDGLYSMVASLFGANVESFGTNQDAFSFRLRQFVVAQRVLEGHLWFGNGLGFLRQQPIYDFYYKFFPYQKYQVTSFDNYYLIKLMETGILGLASFALIALQIAIKCLRNLYKKINVSASRTMIFILISYLLSIATVDESHTLKYLWLMVGFFMCSEFFSLEKDKGNLLSGRLQAPG